MKRSYDFATIGFRPFAETGEFVTIGVLALDVEARHFGFRLLKGSRTARITGLFPTVERALIAEARRKLETELSAIEDAVNTQGPGVDVPLLPVFKDREKGLFSAITTPREGLFCFPVKGRRLAADLATVLDALQARFIDQEGLTVANAAEKQMARALQEILRAARILPAYRKNVKIGPEDFLVSFPLAHLTGERKADRAIKTLNFDLATSTDIYNHGDQWIQRLRRLKRLGYRPDRCLIATREPEGLDDLRIRAFGEIRDELRNDDFVLTSEHDEAQVIDFARI